MTPLSTDDAANLNENYLELVGTTTESNLLAPDSEESLDIYKVRGGKEGYLYTLVPRHTFLNEDGSRITFEAEWIRWSY